MSYIDIVYLHRIIIKYYKISQKDSGAVVPPPTPKSSHIMGQSVFIPPETKLGYFSRFFICFLPREVQGSTTQVSLICKLVDRKIARPILERKVCMFINSITYLDNKS